jgi:hypothetical protein
MPEAPAQMLPFYVGFPVIVPAIAFICAAISFRKKEEKQSLAFTAVVLAIISIALHLFVRWMSA